MPQQNQFCATDAFISSTAINNKVYLHPYKKAERKGDWFEARGYCAANCAEIATIDSSAENDLLNGFLLSIDFNDFAWIGGESYSLNDFTTWTNGQSSTSYSNKAPGEYNDVGVINWTCANVYTTKLWYNYLCNYPSYLIVCQRPASWTICSNGE